MELPAFLRYNTNMSNKLLIKTNSYLKNPVQRKKLLYTTAVSSTAIEGVHAATSEVWAVLEVGAATAESKPLKKSKK